MLRAKVVCCEDTRPQAGPHSTTRRLHRSLRVASHGKQDALWTIDHSTHCNCRPILYHFRVKLRYWLKIENFSIPNLHSMPMLGGPQWNIAITFGTEKLESWGYQTMKKV